MLRASLINCKNVSSRFSSSFQPQNGFIHIKNTPKIKENVVKSSFFQYQRGLRHFHSSQKLLFSAPFDGSELGSGLRATPVNFVSVKHLQEESSKIISLMKHLIFVGSFDCTSTTSVGSRKIWKVS